MARHSIPSSYFLRLGAAILIAAIAEIAPSASSATVVTSAANIPYSGISPGGVNMATGELTSSPIELHEPQSSGAGLCDSPPALTFLGAQVAARSQDALDGAIGHVPARLRPPNPPVDLAIPGPVPVVFGRYYASMLAREGLATGHLGTNWLGTYDWSLSVAMPMVTIVTNRGQRIQFSKARRARGTA